MLNTRYAPSRASSAMSSYAPSTSGNRPAVASSGEGMRSASSLGGRLRPGSVGSMGSSAGRPLVQDPQATVPPSRNRRFVSPTHGRAASSVSLTTVSPTTRYRESMDRLRERQEARSLRDALQEMDLQDEQRIYSSAQDEATELVWNHQHPGMGRKNAQSEFRNPDFGSVRSRYSSLYGRPSKASAVLGQDVSALQSSGGEDFVRSRQRIEIVLPPEEPTLRPRLSSNPVTPRTVSNDSSKGIFRNPNDQIYEEPQTSPAKVEEKHPLAQSYPSALKNRSRNSLPRRFPGQSDDDIDPPPPMDDKPFRHEYHRDSPARSEPAALDRKIDNVPMKDGIEIRSDEIRAATSKKMSDRSSRLPMPTGVSDRPGRPIVSFDPSWEPAAVKEGNQDSKQNASPPPAVPSIQVTKEETRPPPTVVINITPDREPTVSEMMDSQTSSRSLPGQPRSNKAASAARKGQSNWSTPYTRTGVPSATCAACSMAISGRIVAAAGLRLHPECFVCHHCGTQLECVAFYQEPENKRAERLAADDDYDKDEGEEGGGSPPRFYCHLDFHELFSPRCKSCKTPIEGEVVVACGAEWHVGHFFCAECGDVWSLERFLFFSCQMSSCLLFFFFFF